MTHDYGQIRSDGWQAEASGHPSGSRRVEIPLLHRNRRRQMRFVVSGLLSHSPVFGRVVEVSAGGLRLESHAALVVGGSYVFRLNYGTTYLAVAGRALWSRIDRFELGPGGPRAVYGTGVALDTAPAPPAWRSALADRAGAVVGA